jgi:U3 small nucleolar RNA-associated protein 12
VVTLARLPDKVSICAGYSTGEARIFNYINGNLSTTFRGHRSAVTAIATDDGGDGTLMATGGADCDIIVWDLVALSGLVRFHDHKDAITALSFLNVNNRKLLLSVSKDTLFKVWDIESRHCIQTIVGHRAEIWSLAVYIPPPSDQNPNERIRIYTGAADELIIAYKLAVVGEDEQSGNTESSAEEEIIRFYGVISRTSGMDRCASLSINYARNLLAAQSAGKVIDIYRLRDSAESKKKMKRRLKRSQEKKQKSSSNNDNSDNEADDKDISDQEMIFTDEIELIHTLKLATKVRSFVFNPIAFSATDDLALISYVSNTLEIYKVPQTNINGQIPAKLSLIDLQGHRSDVRGLGVSTDGNVIATCSSESIKLWSTRGYQCTSTCYPVDENNNSSNNRYCLYIAFAPGGRYVLCGMKDGALQVRYSTVWLEIVRICELVDFYVVILSSKPY